MSHGEGWGLGVFDRIRRVGEGWCVRGVLALERVRSVGRDIGVDDRTYLSRERKSYRVFHADLMRLEDFLKE